MFSQLAGSLTSIELLYTLFAQCAELSKIKPYDIRAMTSQGGVKSTEMVCVKDNLSSIVEGTHTHAISLVLHCSCTHTEITFPPVVENEAVYQQPVIQLAHLQLWTHRHTHTECYTLHNSLVSKCFPLLRERIFLSYAVFNYFYMYFHKNNPACAILNVSQFLFFYFIIRNKIKIDTKGSALGFSFILLILFSLFSCYKCKCRQVPQTTVDNIWQQQYSKAAKGGQTITMLRIKK